MAIKIEDKKLIEAILFVAGRPIDINSLKKVSEINDDAKILKIIDSINEAYAKRNSFIEILKMDKDFWMRVKPDKKEELPRLEKAKSLSPELMQLLSYIAIKQPIRASEVKKTVKAKKFNDKLALLEKQGFIKSQPYKKTLILTTTLHFASVFNLDPENLKESLTTMLKYKMAERITKGPKEEVKEEEEKKGKKKKYSKKEREQIEVKYKKLIAKKEKQREEDKKRKEEEERLRLEEEQRMAELEVQLSSDPMAQMVQSQFISDQIKEKLKQIPVDTTSDEEVLNEESMNELFEDEIKDNSEEIVEEDKEEITEEDKEEITEEDKEEIIEKDKEEVTEEESSLENEIEENSD